MEGGGDERTRKVIDLKNKMTEIKLYQRGQMVGHTM
jgi:hypothetical protein